MKLFLSLYLTLAAFLPACLALTELEAVRLLLSYAVYDMDYEAWGKRKGHVATDCKGVSLPDGRCTLDEFANFVTTGVAGSEPSYAKLSSGFSFYPGDIFTIVDALMGIDGYLNDVKRLERMVPGRRTEVGLYDDLMTIVNKAHKRTEANTIKRNFDNVKEVVKAVHDYSSKNIQSSLLERVRGVSSVTWKTMKKEAKYYKGPWNKVDWKETVRANPDLRDPKSQLYKDVSSMIKRHSISAGMGVDKTIAWKTAQTFNQCFAK